MRIAVALCVSLIAVVPAASAETAWAELAPGVRARLIAGEVRHSDGTTLAGFEIDMPDMTKTYWRVPGETGIPTEIDTSASEGVGGATILWPYPTVDTAAGYLDYVYYGHTVLPIELKITGDAATLDASITMGICSDVCVPAMAHFTLPLNFAKADAGQGLRISQALAKSPLVWESKQDAIAWVGLDTAADALAVRLGTADVDWSSLIADMGVGGALFGTPQKSPDGRTILLPLLGGGDPQGLLGKSVQLTFQTPMGPFETSRRIAAQAD